MGLTGAGNPLMMKQLAFGCRRPAAAYANTAARQACAFLLPPRSMVGQPPLERHIGVRIPGGQPITMPHMVADFFLCFNFPLHNPSEIDASTDLFRVRVWCFWPTAVAFIRGCMRPRPHWFLSPNEHCAM